LWGFLFTLRLARLIFVIFGVLIVVAVGLGAFVWATRSTALAAYLARTVTEDLFREGFVCELEDVSGSPFGTISLSGIRVFGPGGDTLLVANDVHVRYPLRRALRGDVKLERLDADTLRLRLVEDAAGDIVFPWRTRERARPSIVARQDGVESLTIRDLSVALTMQEGKTVEIVRHVLLEGSVITIADGAALALHARGAVPVAMLELDDLRAEGTIQGSTLRVATGEARIGSSRLTGTGYLSISGPPVLHFDVALPHVETVDAWGIVDLEEVFGHGWVSGTASVDRVPRAAKVTFRLSGELGGDRVDRLEGATLVNNETFFGDPLVIESENARARGTLRLDLIPPRKYEADLRVENLDLSDVPIQGELVKLHPHRINGRLRLRGDDYEREFPRMDVTADIDQSTYLDVPFDSLDAEIALVPARWGGRDSSQVTDRVLVRRATVWQWGGVARGSGTIVPETSCEIDVEAEALPLEAYLPLHRNADLGGRASIRARVEGDLLHPSFTAIGSADTLTVGSLVIDRVDADRLEGALVPFDAFAHARGRGIRAGTWRADSLDATGTIADTVTVEDLTLWRGDSLFTARGAVVPEERGVRGEVTGFRAQLPIADVVLTGSSPIALREGGAWDIGPAGLSVAGGSMELTLSTLERGLSPHVSIVGRGIPVFDLVRIAGHDSLRGAPADFDVDYVGDPAWPRFHGEAKIRDVVLDDVVAPSVSFAWAGAGDSLAVSDLSAAFAPRGAVRGAFVLRGETSPVLGLFSGDPKGRLLRADTELAGFLVGTEIGLDLPGRFRAFAQPRKAAAAPDTNVIVVTEKRFDPWLDLEGSAEGRLELGGRLGDPLIRATLHADSVKVRTGLVIDRVEGSALLREGLLTISQGDLVVAGRHAQISGFLPCTLDLTTGRGRLVEREMLLSIDMAEMPLGLVSLAVPELIVLGGSVTGAGQIAGTPRDPLPSGQFRLADGEARWFGRTEIVHDASAQVDLAREGLILTRFEAEEGVDGRVTATGKARSASDYRFDFNIRDFYFTQGGLGGIASGSLRVSPDSTTAGRVLPRVAGSIDLSEAEIFQWDVPRPEMSPETITALYDLEIDVGRIHVNTNELQTSTNVLVGDGELTLRNYPETIRLGGTLRVLEGTASVYGNQFRVTEGRIDFLEIDGVNPELDITAESPIRGPYAEQHGYAGLDGRIIAHVTGTIRKPVVELTTEPAELALSQSEILEYLTFGRYASGASGLEPTADILLGLLAQDVSYLFPYVDYVEIISDEENPSFHIVKNINEQLSIGYTTGVSSTPDQELSIEARLSRIFVLKGGVLRGEVGSTQDVGGRYNLDLKLNIEY